jgi:hypothetical protein
VCVCGGRWWRTRRGGRWWCLSEVAPSFLLGATSSGVIPRRLRCDTSRLAHALRQEATSRARHSRRSNKLRPARFELDISSPRAIEHAVSTWLAGPRRSMEASHASRPARAPLPPASNGWGDASRVITRIAANVAHGAELDARAERHLQSAAASLRAALLGPLSQAEHDALWETCTAVWVSTRPRGCPPPGSQAVELNRKAWGAAGGLRLPVRQAGDQRRSQAGGGTADRLPSEAGRVRQAGLWTECSAESGRSKLAGRAGKAGHHCRPDKRCTSLLQLRQAGLALHAATCSSWWTATPDASRRAWRWTSARCCCR